MLTLRERTAAVAVSLPFRILLGAGILLFHIGMMSHLANERFGYGFNAAPGAAPSLQAHDAIPRHWDRLVVSRWDAQHYMELGLRGLEYCRDKSQLRPGEHPEDDDRCNIHFYPAYGVLGGAVSRALAVPIDYALLGISLLSSFALILMWTGREMVKRLGVGGAYLSLLLLNLFSTGYTLVTPLTEPLLMALTLAAFLCVEKRWLVVGAVVAGAATSVRITGAATGFAYCAALLVLTWREHPRPGRIWAWRALLMLVSGWGVIALLGYYAWRFGDPLAYVHAHARHQFHHGISLLRILIPDGRLLMESIWAEPNEGILLGSALLWFALGHRAGLGRFPPHARAFWYVLFFGVFGMCMTGSVDYAFGGNGRYALSVLPVFFAMAAVLKSRPAALVLWVFMSAHHYYDANICFFVGQNDGRRLERCGFARHFRSEEIDHESTDKK